SLLQAQKESPDLLPYRRPPRESPPVAADQPRKFETLVDRYAVITPRLSQTVHEQGFDVSLEIVEDRVLLSHRIPGLQRQERLDGAGWARIKRLDAPGRAAADEECQVDRQSQLLPLLVTQTKARQDFDPGLDSPEAGVLAAAEQDRTRRAC